MSIISHYKNNICSAYKHKLTYPLSINSDNILVKDIVSRITEKCKKFDDNIKLQNLEIVKWPFNSWLDYHIDTNPLNDVFASILYLNDNFLGGQTAFDTFEIEPRIGRLLI